MAYGFGPFERQFIPKQHTGIETVVGVVGATPIDMELQTTIISTAAAGAGTFTLPTGDYVGQRKSFKLLLAGGGSFVPSPLITQAGAVATVTLDADGDTLTIEWSGTVWFVVYSTTGVVT